MKPPLRTAVAAVFLLTLAIGTVHAQSLTAKVVTKQGEIARPEEATDGFPDTNAGMSVRGPDAVQLSQILFGFTSDETADWTVVVDADAAVSGPESGQINYNIEISTDGGNNYKSVRNERALFARTKMRFPGAEVPASKMRVRITLYFATAAKAAGAMNLYEVGITAGGGKVKTARPYLATKEGSVFRPAESYDGFPDTHAGLAVNGPKGVALSRLLFGFRSDESAPWTLNIDLDTSTQDDLPVAFNIEASTDGGNTYKSLYQGPGRTDRGMRTYELGEAAASKVRIRLTLYIVKDGKGAGALNLHEVFLTAPAE